MADLPTDFWSGWIAVITVVSLIGLAWLVLSVYFPGSEPEKAETHVWDETLHEGTNPPPMWWFWLILTLLVVTVSYLILYPGLGSYRGVLKWSQGGQLQQSAARYEEEYGAVRQQWLEASMDELRSDADAMRTAGRMFKNNCTTCHGVDARGQASHFPDLTDDDWQWGGTPKQIKQTIMNGRNAAMPPWGPALGSEGVFNVTEYVLKLSGRHQVDRNVARAGEEKFKQLCVSCHGPEGKGNPTLGAPNLTDNVWLYGGSQLAVMQSISQGRRGWMPAHKDRLDEASTHLLTAYVFGLSRQGEQ
ncbi:MAG: cytochrome-c oxidase, cbb3-type subunit III [Gammaproteobacteria bacterium]|nr:cytochrome-c oxidase, cbb3-type subunit III [Gammaproteobacteria bacterium]